MVESEHIFRFGKFELDSDLYELRSQGASVALEPQVFDVLVYLLRHRDRVVSKQELFEGVWGDTFVGEAALSTRIMEARRAIGDSGSAQRLIKTIRSRGYRFVGHVDIGPARDVTRVDASHPIAAQSLAIGDDSICVGREPELREFALHLSAAKEGHGSVVAVSGEPGIGKTRLLEELIGVAVTDGFVAGRGTCFEGSGAPPYWPWTQVMRAMLANPVRGNLGPRELADMSHGFHARDLAASANPTVDPGPARFRLFDSVTQQVTDVAGTKPVLLVFDDIHWADPATLDLLLFVARATQLHGILLVVAMRDAAPDRGQALSELLAALNRSPGLHRIRLAGIGAGDVLRLVQSVGSFTPSVDLIAEIHARTQGNPFFVTEIGRDLNERFGAATHNRGVAEIRVPLGVSEAVRSRVQRLAPDCIEILHMAALIGREFEFRLLSEIADRPAERVIDAMDEAISTHIVRSKGDDLNHYEFNHALIQQALAEDLTIVRRMQIHARIVVGIERLHRADLDEFATELAHHSVAAEPITGIDRVVKYSKRAGEIAVRTFAWNEARAHFSRALAGLRDDSDPVEKAPILFGLGNSELRLLKYPDIQIGWDRVKAAFDIYEQGGEIQSAINVVLGAQGFTPFWVHSTADTIFRALALCEPSSPTEARLRRMYSAAVRYEHEDSSESLNALEKALGIARSESNSRLEAGLLAELSMARLTVGYFEQALETASAALELSRRENLPFDERYAHFISAAAAGAMGQPDRALQHASSEQKLEEQIGSILGGAWNEFQIRYLEGDMDRIAELSEVLDRDYPADYVVRLFSGIGAWTIGEEADLQSRIQLSERDGMSAPLLFQRASSAMFLALTARSIGDRELAIRAGQLGDALLTRDRLTPHVEAYARIASGLAAVVVKDMKKALEHYERYRLNEDVLITFHCPILRERFLGLLAGAASETTKAMGHLQNALETSENLGFLLEQSWALHDLANCILESGQEKDKVFGHELIGDAIRLTSELGLGRIESRLKILQKRVGGE